MEPGSIPDAMDPGYIPGVRDPGFIPDARDLGSILDTMEPDVKDSGYIPDARDPGSIPDARDLGSIPDAGNHSCIPSASTKTSPEYSPETVNDPLLLLQKKQQRFHSPVIRLVASPTDAEHFDIAHCIEYCCSFLQREVDWGVQRKEKSNLASVIFEKTNDRAKTTHWQNVLYSAVHSP
uniref:Uncharacterized protein n=1 Tax=Timema bartmani TaxID=61472 RepID=A0A7R9I275_9NEOP|nr:unnamed protein product [Timema bartmani]